jgi:hypothetical protein
MSVRRMLLGACALVVALAAAAPAQADPVINQRVNLEFDNVNPCTGEPFHYTQDWHVVGHTSIGPDGEPFVTSQQLNTSKTDGVGLITGDRYEVNQVINITDHPFNAAHPFTAVTQVHFIDTGKGDDFFIDETLHETINANGEISIFVESGNVRCGNDNQHVGVKL